MSLVPLPVALPLAVAALLLMASRFAPPRMADIVAIATAAATGILCLALAAQSARGGPLVYWFGAWLPRAPVVLGIGFGVDMASAAIGAFIAFLFVADFVFAWGFFDEAHSQFQVLALLFLAAMIGFSFTRDLFNLFVWFELMSAVAFALTAYQLEMPSLAGALNFVITNSIASFMMLAGIALIYARAGALGFVAIHDAIAQHQSDPLVLGAFCLIAAALLTKAAIVPFHFWLSDAHAVAPSPVSVIFSGAMVSVGLFGLTKLGVQVFSASAPARGLVHDFFLWLGVATALVGACLAWRQRHLKRMLAFSTIAHLGIMLTALAALSSTGVAAILVYFIGHGLVKAALFMLVGVLMATRASVDELDLFECGKDLVPVAFAGILAGLLLGGAPWGILDAGAKLVASAAMASGRPWVTGVLAIATALTGASVLRACGRIFFGLGVEPDPAEANSPSQSERERANRPLWLMMIPCLALLASAILPGEIAEAYGVKAAGSLALYLPGVAKPPATEFVPWLSTFLALAMAGLELFRDKLPTRPVQLITDSLRMALAPIERLHSGLANDYVLWMVFGVASFSLLLLIR